MRSLGCEFLSSKAGSFSGTTATLAIYYERNINEDPLVSSRLLACDQKGTSVDRMAESPGASCLQSPVAMQTPRKFMILAFPQSMALFDEIDILIARQPRGGTHMLATFGSTPAAVIPSGGTRPAGFGRRKPDIAAAEHRLIAAPARPGAVLSEHCPAIRVGELAEHHIVKAARLTVAVAAVRECGRERKTRS